MYFNFLFYLIFLFFSLGQIGRVSLLNGQVNFYLYEVLMMVFFLSLFFKFRFIPFTIYYKKLKIFFVLCLFMIFSFFVNSLKISMGMSQGPVLMGSFGSIHRLEYTLLGQPLTRAHQLQRLTRSYGLGLLVDNSIRKSMEVDIHQWQDLKDLDSSAPSGVYIWC